MEGCKTVCFWAGNFDYFASSRVEAKAGTWRKCGRKRRARVAQGELDFWTLKVGELGIDRNVSKGKNKYEFVSTSELQVYSWLATVTLFFL